MKKLFTAIPKDDLEMEPHTWDKGEAYQMVEKSDYYVLASNEGQTNIMAHNRSKLDDMFDIREGWN